MTLAEQVCALPEIEFQELMEQVADHVQKNKLDHIIDNAFDSYQNMRHEIEELQDEKGKLEDEVLENKEAAELIRKIKNMVL